MTCPRTPEQPVPIGHVIREAIQNGAHTLILLTETLPDAVLRRFHFEKRDRQDFDIQMAGSRGWELSRGSDQPSMLEKAEEIDTSEAFRH